MSDLNMNSIVQYKKGKKLNMAEFAELALIDPMNHSLTLSTARILINKGDLTVVDERSKVEKSIDNATEEFAYQAIVDNITTEEEAHKTFIRNQKLDQTNTHTFDLAFVTTIEATKFEMWVKGLGITQTALMKDPETGAIKLLIQEVTPIEYTRITTKYSAENAINGAMQTTGKALTGATNAVNYGLTNVVAPTAKIVGEAGMNLGKGLFHTGVKTLAGLVNSGAKAVTDTKVALMTDPECLRAHSQLISAKNDIRRGINSKLTGQGFGNGITNY